MVPPRFTRTSLSVGLHGMRSVTARRAVCTIFSDCGTAPWGGSSPGKRLSGRSSAATHLMLSVALGREPEVRRRDAERGAHDAKFHCLDGAGEDLALIGAGDGGGDKMRAMSGSFNALSHVQAGGRAAPWEG